MPLAEHVDCLLIDLTARPPVAWVGGKPADHYSAHDIMAMMRAYLLWAGAAAGPDQLRAMTEQSIRAAG